METIFSQRGRPVFVLGGQAHNSSTYSARDRELFWKALDALNANTAEIPVYWEAVEPEEGRFDFSQVDTLFQEAAAHDKYLILLWFGTWKNGNMRYVPAWVKLDSRRFKRVLSGEGNSLFVLSSHCEENREADARAFAAFMGRCKTLNADGRLLAVQVENEAGIAGRSYRDFSPLGQADYERAVPEGLLDLIEQNSDTELFAQWESMGKKRGAAWEESFGIKAGAENLTAYSTASYIDKVAAAGKEVCDIPLYTNAALDGYVYGWNLPGINYTGGGPIPRLYPIWKYAAPHLDLLAPDIYHNSRRIYEEVCRRYNQEDNALFVPESGYRGIGNAKNLFYALGTYGAVGYAVFGVEGILTKEGTPDPRCRELLDSFASISAALPLLTKHRGTGRIHTVVQEEFDEGWHYRTEAYIVKVDFSPNRMTNYIHRAIEESSRSGGPSRGRGLIIQEGRDEFFILGTDFTVTFAPRDDIFYSEDRITNHMPYLTVEEGRFDSAGRWIRERTRTGDECDHGIWVFAENRVVRCVLCP
ncbi:MAG: DUF5597 domain-containing protein [Treponema sp.]|jgi:hypothetical protein|nr:DUF5597 domain-containing protein [Treponema sp.]